MKCVLEKNSVKVFGKALHALSRIGDELWLDPMAKGLALRAVNSAQSAYACFLFTPLFFQHYSQGTLSKQDCAPVRCKLSIKSVLPLFRCLTSIERNVEQCQILICTSSDQVKIQFFCRHGITKTHNLHFQESEALQAVFSSLLCPNVLKAPARLLADIVMPFPVSQEEITLSVTPLRVTMRNYYEEANITEGMRTMHTEMSLHPDEFDFFGIGRASDITFCLKELRGLLSFAESHCLPVSVYFGAGGKPVCFSVDNMMLKATIVLATLTESEYTGPSQPAESLDTVPPSYCTLVGSWCTSTNNYFICSMAYHHLISRWCAADVPVESCEAESAGPQGVSADMEMIASSQGSPIVNPPLVLCLTEGHPKPSSVNQVCTSAIVSPAFSTICSLLFKAMSSEQDSCAAKLPVLACSSDGEEGLEEDRQSSTLNAEL